MLRLFLLRIFKNLLKLNSNGLNVYFKIETTSLCAIYMPCQHMYLKGTGRRIDRWMKRYIIGSEYTPVSDKHSHLFDFTAITFWHVRGYTCFRQNKHVVNVGFRSHKKM